MNLLPLRPDPIGVGPTVRPTHVADRARLARLLLLVGLAACSSTEGDLADTGADTDTASASGGGSAGTGATPSAFRGVWVSSPSRLNRFEARGDALVFLTIGATDAPDSWASAQENGFIDVGDPFLDDIRAEGDGYAVSVLWFTGSESEGVTDVDWDRGGFVTFSEDGASLYVETTSPFSGNSGTGTFTRE